MKKILNLFVLCLFIACQPQNDSIQRINIDKQLAMTQDENVIVIDVRTPSEVASGYIKGTSQFIDYKSAEFKEQISALDKDKTYIVYCRSGNRSTKALNVMSELGYKNLYELQGGISGVSNTEYIIK